MLKMKRRRIYYYFLVAALQIMSWACAASIIDVAHHHQDTVQVMQTPQLPFPSKQGIAKMDKPKKKNVEIHYYTTSGFSKLGSRPPNCKHKCGGCAPCIAIQVPRTTTHLEVQYTNYEPEGWKCKCGPTIFNP